MTLAKSFNQQNNSIDIGIIDDDIFYASVIVRQLKRAGLKVTFNAQDAFSGIAELHAMLILPQVLITDLEMPVMDGFEVINYVKQTWPDLKIIAHSSLTGDSITQQAVAKGADMFVPKLSDAFKLINSINILSQL